MQSLILLFAAVALVVSPAQVREKKEPLKKAPTWTVHVPDQSRVTKPDQAKPDQAKSVCGPAGCSVRKILPPAVIHETRPTLIPSVKGGTRSRVTAGVVWKHGPLGLFRFPTRR
jgi:hypothetical protein